MPPELDQVLQGITQTMLDPEWQAKTLFFLLGMVIGKLFQYAIWPVSRYTWRGVKYATVAAVKSASSAVMSTRAALTAVPKLDKVKSQLSLLRAETGVDFKFLNTPKTIALMGGEFVLEREVSSASQRGRLADDLIDEMRTHVRITTM